MLEGRAPVVRSDGSPERDFLYVEDAVGAYLAIADLLDAGAAGGRGVQRRLRRAAQRARRRHAPSAPPRASTLAPDVRGTGTPDGEIDRQWVDPSKLAGLSGWEPQVELDDGLRRTIDWYRANPELPRGA